MNNDVYLTYSWEIFEKYVNVMNIYLNLEIDLIIKIAKIYVKLKYMNIISEYTLDFICHIF